MGKVSFIGISKEIGRVLFSPEPNPYHKVSDFYMNNFLFIGLVNDVQMMMTC